MFQHYNQIHHKEEMIFVLIQKIDHLKIDKQNENLLFLAFNYLKLFAFALNYKNDLRNYELKQVYFHIDVLSREVAEKRNNTKK